MQRASQRRQRSSLQSGSRNVSLWRPTAGLFHTLPPGSRLSTGTPVCIECVAGAHYGSYNLHDGDKSSPLLSKAAAGAEATAALLPSSKLTLHGQRSRCPDYHFSMEYRTCMFQIQILSTQLNPGLRCI